MNRARCIYTLSRVVRNKEETTSEDIFEVICGAVADNDEERRASAAGRWQLDADHIRHRSPGGEIAPGARRPAHRRCHDQTGR